MDKEHVVVYNARANTEAMLHKILCPPDRVSKC